MAERVPVVCEACDQPYAAHFVEGELVLPTNDGRCSCGNEGFTKVEVGSDGARAEHEPHATIRQSEETTSLSVEEFEARLTNLLQVAHESNIDIEGDHIIGHPTDGNYWEVEVTKIIRPSNAVGSTSGETED